MVNNIRAYETPNLLRYNAEIYYQTEPADASNDAVNLIENIESRSPTDLWNARIDIGEYFDGNRASYKSCYKTD